MYDQPKGSIRPAPKSSLRPTENAFSALFLDRARRRPEAAELAASPLSRESHYRGPWEVERVPSDRGPLWAVVRRAEPAREGGGAVAAFLTRPDALLAAATLSALASRNRLHLNPEKLPGRRRLGVPIHDGTAHLGHVARADDDFLAYYHAHRCLAANSDAAALFLTSLDTETLAILGRATMRRLPKLR